MSPSRCKSRRAADCSAPGARPPGLMDLVEVDPRSTQPAGTGDGVPPHGRGHGCGRVELGCHERRARVLGPARCPGCARWPRSRGAEPGRRRQRRARVLDRTEIVLRSRRSRQCQRASHRVPRHAGRWRSRPQSRTAPRSSIPSTRTARCRDRSWKSASWCRCSGTALGMSPINGRIRRRFVKRPYTRTSQTSPGTQSSPMVLTHRHRKV